MEWIKTSERLPHNQNDVLVTDGMSFAIGNCRWHSVDDHSWSVQGMYASVKSGKITHWMKIELPSAPKSEP